jgi:hypothetical protein
MHVHLYAEISLCQLIQCLVYSANGWLILLCWLNVTEAGYYGVLLTNDLPQTSILTGTQPQPSKLGHSGLTTTK